MPIILSAGELRRLDASMSPVPPELASLYGDVVDADTGYPVAGVLVEVRGTPLTAYTLSDGSYEIPGIFPGTYTIRFTHVDYEPLEI